MANSERIQYLLRGWTTKTSTAAEEEELLALIEEEGGQEEIRQHVEGLISNHDKTEILPAVDWETLYNRIRTGAGIEKKETVVRKMNWLRWVAAAAVLIIIATTAIVISKRSEKSPATEVAKTNDVEAPSNTRAVITLADGSKVYLDSAGNGTIAQENNVAVVKNSDGSIIYSHEGTKEQSEIAYNTLSNPRGSKVISLTLSDGTKVWLNSESSLKYPIAFNGISREVEITGEAYFEVKHNAKQPFKVHLPNGSIVEDLGTAFNINAYADEQDIKTTLVEGSVKITNTISNSSASSVTLRPGEQSTQSISNRVIRVLNNVDLEEVTAWKNGSFSYTNSDLETIMRQMARWYDVEVIYKDRITDRYTVDVPRTVPVSQLFKFIEMSGGVKFEIEGKKIIVHK